MSDDLREQLNRLFPGGSSFAGPPRAKPDGLRFGPYEVSDHFLPPHILFRHVYNDVNVTDWQQLQDCNGTSLNDLIVTLRREYGHEPDLRRGTTFSQLIIEDQHSNQFWGVEHLGDLPTLVERPWTTLR